MNFSKRQRPSSPEQIEASAYAVIDTVRETGLDPRSTLIMGRSALALAGIRPARDVDLIIPDYLFYTVAHNRSTPGGTALQYKSSTLYPVLETYSKRPPKDLMHIDITTPKRDYGHDAKFLKELELYDTFEGYRFLPAELVAERKMKRGDHMRNKDQRDVELIRRHLEEIERRNK
jgi:hypothetical protein